MRIALGTIDIDREGRCAINRFYGDPGPASRERCRNFVINNGLLALQDLYEQPDDDAEDD